MVNRQTMILTIKIQKVLLICKNSRVYYHKNRKKTRGAINSKIKNLHGLLGRPLHDIVQRYHFEKQAKL